MSIAVITRFCFSEPVEERRLELFQKGFIDSLCAQTIKDFEVFVNIGPNRMNKNKSHPNNIDAIHRLNWKGISYKIIKFFPTNFEIAVKIDSDDSVAPDFLDIAFKKHSTLKENRSRLVTYQPMARDWDTGEIYHTPIRTSKDTVSMFYALCQKKKRKIPVHKKHHLYMGKLFKDIIIIPEGKCLVNIHGLNKQSYLDMSRNFIPYEGPPLW